MKIKSMLRICSYSIAIGISTSLIFFVIICAWIGYEVKSQCHKALPEYGGDCVEVFEKLLDNTNKGFRASNDATRALEQPGDRQALPALESYYTGNIPPREPLDQSLSQYEITKAINLIKAGENINAWSSRRFNGTAIIKQDQKTETVVVSQKTDSYYRLAKQIAQEENLEIIEEFEDILKIRPKFVILVASPDQLTAERLSRIGQLFQQHNYFPGLGIISGSTLEKAERVWERRNQVKEGANYLGGDVDILQMIYEPTIYNISDRSPEKIALNKENLITTLKQADYFYWSRHTGPRDWSWNEEGGNWSENDQLLASDIPDLKPVVIYSLTCSAFRPWVEDSIAMGFVDQGAVAYLGFVNTPHTITFSREGFSVPGITSWKEFPLGLVAQIHNKAAAKSVFRSPQLFMLGDPRIYLSKEQPYRITSDREISNEKRMITGVSDEVGVLAVKITGGADYRYLSVKGLTAVSESDIFYNNKLQALNLGEDKYVLFLHSRGSFEIELLKRAPLGWQLSDAFVDSFDFSWVVLWLSTYADGNPNILLISLPIFIGVILFKITKGKKAIKDYYKVFLVAFSFTLIRLAYYLLRLDDYTVSANLAVYSPPQITLGCLGIFASIAGGLIIMRDGTKFRTKLFGLLFAISRQLWMAGFYLVFITLLNVVPPITRNTETWLLSYDNFWLSLIVLFVEVIAVLASYQYVIQNKRWRQSKTRHI